MTRSAIRRSVEVVSTAERRHARGSISGFLPERLTDFASTPGGCRALVNVEKDGRHGYRPAPAEKRELLQPRVGPAVGHVLDASRLPESSEAVRTGRMARIVRSTCPRRLAPPVLVVRGTRCGCRGRKRVSL